MTQKGRNDGKEVEWVRGRAKEQLAMGIRYPYSLSFNQQVSGGSEGTVWGDHFPRPRPWSNPRPVGNPHGALRRTSSRTCFGTSGMRSALMDTRRATSSHLRRPKLLCMSGASGVRRGFPGQRTRCYTKWWVYSIVVYLSPQKTLKGHVTNLLCPATVVFSK